MIEPGEIAGGRPQAEVYRRNDRRCREWQRDEPAVSPFPVSDCVAARPTETSRAHTGRSENASLDVCGPALLGRQLEQARGQDVGRQTATTIDPRSWLEPNGPSTELVDIVRKRRR